MDYYDPEVEPVAEEWLELDEDERISLVEVFHESAGIEPPESGSLLHASFHVIVENQVAMGVEGVREAIARLVEGGLPRHEAVHAVAAVVSEDLFDLMEGTSQKFNAERYRGRLDKLTAKRWRKGKW